VPGATYNWTVPFHATLVSGQNTPSASVNFANNFSSGNVGVQATTPCGWSTVTTWVTKIPGCRLMPDGVEEEENGVVALYPNPSSTGLLTIRFYAGVQSTYLITLTDIAGRTVYTIRSEAVEGENLTTLDFSKLSRGTYVLVLDNGDTKTMHKVILD
jgi:hypothetical protein